MTTMPDSIEGTIIVVVRWVKLGVEFFGAGLVTLGVSVAVAQEALLHRAKYNSLAVQGKYSKQTEQESPARSKNHP